ncbi:membrane protein [Pseudomonas fluorescens NCIMB 11764]|uniref:Membrane protein n=1 Tax=Pseudomonas fluorescens NCIMB 11764 TaxID=1221522 RepID=A0A0K1QWA8_PSEFL|nr:outer membrane protein OmpK [Pseudomonas fluorescens]AKV10046.1 membrane protein [Pseudomonas fluorescens NCIMB 11764]
MKDKIIKACLLLSAAVVAPISQADGKLLWHQESISYQYGKDFKVDPRRMQIITFEHTSAWEWGDFFFFIDNYWYPGAQTAYDGHHGMYSEYSPRFSLSKITGNDYSWGIVKDVLVATAIEWDNNRSSGRDDQVNYLVGPGFDLSLPGFDYFMLNFYYRKPEGGEGMGGWQVTPVWSYTVPVGKSNIVVDGYIDWVLGDKYGLKHNFHFNPQIKYDIGKAFWSTPSKIYVGIEYDYWSNKYGIENTSAYDTNQNVTSAIVKYYF